MAFSLGEYQDVFLEEADDQLQELNANLLQMEKNPDNEDIINNIFRAAHSLKSSAAFVGLNDLSDLAHKMENLLQGVRDKTMKITPEIIDLLFKCFDHINNVIEQVSSGKKPDVDLSEVIKEIKKISESGTSAEAESNGPTQKRKTRDAAPSADDNADNGKVDLSSIPKTSFSGEERKQLKIGVNEGQNCYEVIVYIDKDAQMKWVKAQLILNNLRSICEVIKTIPAEDDLTDENITDFIKIIVLSHESIENVCKECDVDLITSVVAGEVSLDKQGGKYVLTFHTHETYVDNEKEDTSVIDFSKPESEEKADDGIEITIEDDELSETIPETSKAKSSTSRKAPTLRTVKVSVEKLDELLNNVGELVIANSGFFRLYEDLQKLDADKTLTNEFKNRMEQMARIAKDLQSGIMKTRMVPIGQVFSRFNRLVRDLAKDCGKNVQLVTKGEDTELDKKVIDVIGEPLMHMVRNSTDHGMETDEEREKLRKPVPSTVTLSAHQGGNQIYVEVSDDGKGLDVEKIKQKAISRGLTTKEITSGMDDSEIYDFIFHPGFSTADKITDVSGRGVGMNVVKEVVQEMNGSINIESEPGMGTRFIMAFPLTLAIIPAIMVNVEIETYAIPLSDVIETIKISPKDVTTIEGHEVINLRGEILSLLRLDRFVGLDKDIHKNQKIPVVVVGYSNRKIGLVVDQLEGKFEIVIKSLEQNYRHVEGLAGASILGDGSICLILDISSMMTKVISEQDKLSREDRKAILSMSEAAVEKMEDGSSGSIVFEDMVKDVSERREMSQEDKDKFFEDLKNSETIVPASLKALEERTYDNVMPDMGEIETETFGNTEDKTFDVSDEEEIQITEEKPDLVIDEDVEGYKEEPEIEEDMSNASDEMINDDADIIIEEEVIKSEDSDSTFDIFEDQTTPVSSEAVDDEEVDDKVKEVLNNFRQELHDSVKNTMEGDPNAHMQSSLEIGDNDLRKIQAISNVGIMKAAESLSAIIGKRVDLAIPEVKIVPVENIPASLGMVDETYVGVYMPLGGAIKGTILFSIPEDAGFSLVDDLYNFEIGETKEFNDDAKSSLLEVTNIVGSSVLNSFSEKTGLTILPEVPTFVHDYIQSIMDSILVMHNVENDYALIMSTEFYFDDDRIMGNLLILPDTSSLNDLVENIKE